MTCLADDAQQAGVECTVREVRRFPGDATPTCTHRMRQQLRDLRLVHEQPPGAASYASRLADARPSPKWNTGPETCRSADVPRTTRRRTEGARTSATNSWALEVRSAHPMRGAPRRCHRIDDGPLTSTRVPLDRAPRLNGSSPVARTLRSARRGRSSVRGSDPPARQAHSVRRAAHGRERLAARPAQLRERCQRNALPAPDLEHPGRSSGKSKAAHKRRHLVALSAQADASRAPRSGGEEWRERAQASVARTCTRSSASEVRRRTQRKWGAGRANRRARGATAHRRRPWRAPDAARVETRLPRDRHLSDRTNAGQAVRLPALTGVTSASSNRSPHTCGDRAENYPSLTIYDGKGGAGVGDEGEEAATEAVPACPRTPSATAPQTPRGDSVRNGGDGGRGRGDRHATAPERREIHRQSPGRDTEGTQRELRRHSRRRTRETQARADTREIACGKRREREETEAARRNRETEKRGVSPGASCDPAHSGTPDTRERDAERGTSFTVASPHLRHTRNAEHVERRRDREKERGGGRRRRGRRSSDRSTRHREVRAREEAPRYVSSGGQRVCREFGGSVCEVELQQEARTVSAEQTLQACRPSASRAG